MRRTMASRFSRALLVGSLLGMLVGIEAVSLAQSRTLTFDEVRAIVLARLPGARDLEIELRAGDGSTRGLYEVELRDAGGLEHDIGVDALSGDVLYDQLD